MPQPTAKASLASTLTFIADGLGALLLTLYALIIGPLGILRGPLVLERLFWYMWVLCPLNLLTRTLRMGIDWRVGNFAMAIIQAESIIITILESFVRKPTSAKRRVLIDLYAVLTRAHLHVGDIDKAMTVVLQAQKNAGIDRLPGLVDLDAKTAHLIRAGIAAGRLLDGGGLATMFIKTNDAKTSGLTNIDSPHSSTRGETKPPRNPDKKKESSPKSAVIIPFPLQ